MVLLIDSEMTFFVFVTRTKKAAKNLQVTFLSGMSNFACLVSRLLFSRLLLMHESAANERTPLVVATSPSLTHRGSVVSYTLHSKKQCANIIGSDSTATRSTQRKLLFATAMALLFFTAELIAGYFANSLGNVALTRRTRRDKQRLTSIIYIALMSDAFHLLSDVASFIVALAAIYLAEKPATKRKFLFGVSDLSYTSSGRGARAQT